MSEQFADIEGMLRRALSPVEPPAELEARLETTLGSLVDMATEELEGWELSSMGDPRNWTRVARPVAAVTVARPPRSGSSSSAPSAAGTSAARRRLGQSTCSA